MKRLLDLLNGFGFEYDEVLDAYTRTWSKEVEVVWYGRQTSTYCVAVSLWSSETAHVVFMKNGQVEKVKNYCSGVARTLNAIKATVGFAGFEF